MPSKIGNGKFQYSFNGCKYNQHHYYTCILNTWFLDDTGNCSLVSRCLLQWSSSVCYTKTHRRSFIKLWWGHWGEWTSLKLSHNIKINWDPDWQMGFSWVKWLYYTSHLLTYDLHMTHPDAYLASLGLLKRWLGTAELTLTAKQDKVKHLAWLQGFRRRTGPYDSVHLHVWAILYSRLYSSGIIHTVSILLSALCCCAFS